MFSICTTSIGASVEVRAVLDYLRRINEPGTYEYCLIHDDRYDYGDDHVYLTRLTEQYPEFKLGRRGPLEAIHLLVELLEHYESNDWFTPEYRKLLKENLFKEASGTLYNRTEEFLWLSSGPMFNMASDLASGEVLFFCPHDHLLPFNLRWAEDFVQRSSKMSRFYYKVNSFKGGVILNQDGTLMKEEPRQLVEHNHGVHLMTRGSFEAIGGFSEEFHWRSSADDAMTVRGQREPSYDGRVVGLYTHQSYPEISVPGKVRKTPRYLHDGVQDLGPIVEFLGKKVHQELGKPIIFNRLEV